MRPPSPLVDERSHLLVLTGAGVSAESGIPTFRGAGGLWENHRFEDVASPEGFAADPALVWRFYSERRRAAAPCLPNPAHHALCQVERRLGDRFLLVTQNVDGLHRRAGSTRLIELHGNLFETRCTTCDSPAFADSAEHIDELPRCRWCAERGQEALLRPNVVWFGEMLDGRHLESIAGFMGKAPEGALVFLAVGTSGAVYPAAGLVGEARSRGARTWLVNADPADNGRHFQHFVRGSAGEVLPNLLDPWSTRS